ncbi:hypothetical protein M569_04526 [Genlisea aurea]|uniref:Uncharacterized protein n=1 Tax=Genlisea aurea TaxID=192259 RepID=S8CYX6_9LAMI|nr:hypothetical protein M569_04526 [Genlisea aurea]
MREEKERQAEGQTQMSQGDVTKHRLQSTLDQASLLDEAAKRIKLLQSQLQMMMIQGTTTRASPQMGGIYPYYPFPPTASFFCPPPRTSTATATEPFGFLPVPPPGIIVPWAYQGQSSSYSQFPDLKQLP